mmetsp:Transcript_152202/g.276851  ORF Transcript_152202/g.276851 Transcript_152202/m.276851 type:complete len:553 (-) Transcript_152202:96-1754(-)
MPRMVRPVLRQSAPTPTTRRQGTSEALPLRSARHSSTTSARLSACGSVPVTPRGGHRSCHSSAMSVPNSPRTATRNCSPAVQRPSAVSPHHSRPGSPTPSSAVFGCASSPVLVHKFPFSQELKEFSPCADTGATSQISYRSDEGEEYTRQAAFSEHTKLINLAIASVMARVETLERHSDPKLMNERLEKLEARADAVDIASFMGRVELLEARMEGIPDEKGSLLARFETFDGALEAMAGTTGERLQEIETKSRALMRDFEAGEAKFESTQIEVNSWLGKLDDNVTMLTQIQQTAVAQVMDLETVSRRCKQDLQKLWEAIDSHTHDVNVQGAEDWGNLDAMHAAMFGAEHETQASSAPMPLQTLRELEKYVGCSSAIIVPDTGASKEDEIPTPDLDSPTMQTLQQFVGSASSILVTEPECEKEEEDASCYVHQMSPITPDVPFDAKPRLQWETCTPAPKGMTKEDSTKQHSSAHKVTFAAQPSVSVDLPLTESSQHRIERTVSFAAPPSVLVELPVTESSQSRVERMASVKQVGTLVSGARIGEADVCTMTGV